MYEIANYFPDHDPLTDKLHITIDYNKADNTFSVVADGVPLVDSCDLGTTPPNIPNAGIATYSNSTDGMMDNFVLNEYQAIGDRFELNTATRLNGSKLNGMSTEAGDAEWSGINFVFGQETDENNNVNGYVKPETSSFSCATVPAPAFDSHIKVSADIFSPASQYGWMALCLGGDLTGDFFNLGNQLTAFYRNYPGVGYAIKVTKPGLQLVGLYEIADYFPDHDPSKDKLRITLDYNKIDNTFSVIADGVPLVDSYALGTTVPDTSNVGIASYAESTDGMADNFAVRKGFSRRLPSYLLFVGIKESELTKLWKDDLPLNGWENIKFVEWDYLTPELLQLCKMVVIVRLPLKPIKTTDQFNAEPDEDMRKVDMLVDYVKAGGGLLLNQQAGQMLTGMTLPFYLADRFGTKLLYEKVYSYEEEDDDDGDGLPDDDDPLVVHIGSWDQDKFTYTDAIDSSVSQGVTGVLYPSYIAMGLYNGILPFLPNDDWTVVLHTGSTSYTTPSLTGLTDFDKDMRAQGFSGNVPLVGIRELGAGRVGYCGMRCDMIFYRSLATETDIANYEAYMKNGYGNYSSDLERFYLNLFQWLSEHSDKLRNVALKKGSFDVPPLTTDENLYKGIIGARTLYSSGTSSVDDYVNAAKAANLDFIVFLEDFGELKTDAEHPTIVDTFNALKDKCKEVSESGDGSFLAIPGFTYINSDGNHEYVFGRDPIIPSSLIVDDATKRFKVWPKDPASNQYEFQANGKWLSDLQWLYGMLGFENHSGWYRFPRDISKTSSSPFNPGSSYSYFDTRSGDSIAVVVQEKNGDTIETETNWEIYGKQARNGQYLWPVALTLMTSASEISNITNGSYYCNILKANGTEQLAPFLYGSSEAFQGMQGYSGTLQFGAMSVSQGLQGPQIDLKMPRGDVDPKGEPYDGELQKWDLVLDVTSDVGLKEVLIKDGDTMIRKFSPNKKTTFHYETSLTRERQKHIWVEATDDNDRKAISRDILCNSYLLRETQCGDRQNQLLYSRQKRLGEDAPDFFIANNTATATPTKGLWSGVINPVTCFIFDSVLGCAAAFDGVPAGDPYVKFSPAVFLNGQNPAEAGEYYELVAGLEGPPHNKPHRVIASSDVLIGDRILDGVFPFATHPDPENPEKMILDYPVYNVWHTLYPVTPSSLIATTARTYFYRMKPTGISAYLWDQSLTAKQDITLGNSNYSIKFGSIYSDQAENILFVQNGVEQISRQKPLTAEQSDDYNFNAGDYFCFANGPYGSVIVYNVGDPLILWTDYINAGFGYKTSNSSLQVGTTIHAKLLVVGIDDKTYDTLAEVTTRAAKIKADYGLGGSTPAYSVTAQHGQVVSLGYIAELAADDSITYKCFKGTFSGLADLSGNLGCMVSGLNANWSACLQVNNANDVKTRFIPVADKEGGDASSKGYLVLDADKDNGTGWFIGHPITADDPNIVLNLSQAKDTYCEETKIWSWKWRLEIHNPTDQTRTVTINTNPNLFDTNWTGWTINNKTVTIPAGASRYYSYTELLEE
ncbi:MAG: hypothetical protein JXA01_05685 [Dehalococcoidia bacterium]|nr:hypothetical protein [Dehalococcoidia bacterium]